MPAPRPYTDRDLTTESRNTFYSIVTASQPLTQGVRIRAGQRAAEAAYRRTGGAPPRATPRCRTSR